MNRFFALAALVGTLAVGGACGSNGPATTGPAAAPVQAATPVAEVVHPSKAHQDFDKMSKKYEADLKELRAAFPDNLTDPWQHQIDSACHPSPDDQSGEALAMMLVSPVLARHGHDYIQFKADWKPIDDEIVAEGLCVGTTTTTSTMKAWNDAVDEWNALVKQRDAARDRTVVVAGKSFDTYKDWAAANGKPLAAP